MVSLAENGIQQAITQRDEATEEDQLIMNPDDKKAIEILKWLYDQKDIRNALYYTNEFARRLLLQERIKGVMTLMKQFSSPVEEAISDEIQAFWEERQKIERLTTAMNQAASLGLNVNNDLEYYEMEDSIRKQSGV